MELKNDRYTQVAGEISEIASCSNNNDYEEANANIFWVLFIAVILYISLIAQAYYVGYSRAIQKTDFQYYPKSTLLSAPNDANCGGTLTTAEFSTNI